MRSRDEVVVTVPKPWYDTRLAFFVRASQI